jgi:hypothetical protein
MYTVQFTYVLVSMVRYRVGCLKFWHFLKLKLANFVILVMESTQKIKSLRLSNSSIMLVR